MLKELTMLAKIRIDDAGKITINLIPKTVAQRSLCETIRINPFRLVERDRVTTRTKKNNKLTSISLTFVPK